jgi:hypothetical protein
VFDKLTDVINPLPEINDQVPVPIAGVFPAKLVAVPQTEIVVPALEMVGI